MKNEKIGELGRAFIAQRTELGIDFDEAWTEWERISIALHFILVDCPEVAYYDDRRVVDNNERLRIRRLAKEKIGRHVRSPDVSALGDVARLLGVRIPVRPYHISRDVLRDVFRQFADEWAAGKPHAEKLAVQLRRRVDKRVEAVAPMVERFAETHSLWAVPQHHVAKMYLNHVLTNRPVEKFLGTQN